MTAQPTGVEHEDYQLLVAIKDLTEAAIEEAHNKGEQYTLDARTSQYIDTVSLSHFAMQMGAAHLGLTSSIEINERREEVMDVASVFVQGFAFGAQFQQTRTPLRRRNARSGDPRKRARA